MNKLTQIQIDSMMSLLCPYYNNTQSGTFRINGDMVTYMDTKETKYIIERDEKKYKLRELNLDLLELDSFESDEAKEIKDEIDQIDSMVVRDTEHHIPTVDLKLFQKKLQRMKMIISIPNDDPQIVFDVIRNQIEDKIITFIDQLQYNGIIYSDEVYNVVNEYHKFYSSVYRGPISITTSNLFDIMFKEDKETMKRIGNILESTDNTFRKFEKLNPKVVLFSKTEGGFFFHLNSITMSPIISDYYIPINTIEVVYFIDVLNDKNIHKSKIV